MVVGLLASHLMTVYRSPRTGGPASRAGFGYALIWIVVVGARAAFSYGSEHWFTSQLGSWMMHHQVGVNASTDPLILMAIALTLTRTLVLAGRAATVVRTAPQPARSLA